MAAGGRGGAKNAESCIARSRLVLLVVVVSGGSFYYMHPPLFYSLESPSSIRPPFQIHSTFSFIHEGGREGEAVFTRSTGARGLCLLFKMSCVDAMIPCVR